MADSGEMSNLDTQTGQVSLMLMPDSAGGATLDTSGNAQCSRACIFMHVFADKT